MIFVLKSVWWIIISSITAAYFLFFLSYRHYFEHYLIQFWGQILIVTVWNTVTDLLYGLYETDSAFLIIIQLDSISTQEHFIFSALRTTNCSRMTELLLKYHGFTPLLGIWFPCPGYLWTTKCKTSNSCCIPSSFTWTIKNCVHWCRNDTSYLIVGIAYGIVEFVPFILWSAWQSCFT